VGGLFFACLLAAVVHGADLGAKVAYKKDAPVPFANFTVTFIGERRVSTSKFPPGMTFYDFRITSAVGNQTIAWSYGTGDIGPTIFRVTTHWARENGAIKGQKKCRSFPPLYQARRIWPTVTTVRTISPIRQAAAVTLG